MTIDRAIIDHAEVPAEERKLALKPPTPGVELSKGQAEQLVRSIASDLETLARSGLAVAANVTKFIDGNGAEAIDEGWKAYPFAYLGGVIGVEADYIRRLHRAGQVLHEIQRKPIGLQPRNPHQLTPMYRMIVDGRGDEIPKAWALADEIRSHDVLTWQGDKKDPPKQINAGHVRRAVKNMLGPSKRQNAEPIGSSSGNGKAVAPPSSRRVPNTVQVDEQPALQKDTPGLLSRLLRLLGDAMTAIRGRDDTPEEIKAAVVGTYQLICDATQAVTT